MPIRDDEKFCECFLADTEEEANNLLEEFDYNLNLISNKLSRLTGIDREDLKSEGIIGLARAKRDFDETRSDNFTIFALYKIKDAMREFISTQAIDVRVPQYIVDASRLGSVLKGLVEKAFGIVYGSLSDVWNTSSKYKKDNELAKEIQNTREKIENLADRSHTSVVDLLERADVMPSTEASLVRKNMSGVVSNTDQHSELEYKNLVEDLRDCLDKERFRQMFDLHFIEGYTIREIADKLGVSDGTIAVQMKQLKTKLRHRHTYLQDLDAKSRACPPVVDAEIRQSKFDESKLVVDALSEKKFINIISDKESIKRIRDMLTEDEFNLLWWRYVEGRTVRELEEKVGIKGPTISVRTKNIINKVLKNKGEILGHESDSNIKEIRSGDSS